MDNYKMKEKLEQLEKRIKVYEEALRFYANESNWAGAGQGVKGRIRADYEFVINENFRQIAGRRARLALEDDNNDRG